MNGNQLTATFSGGSQDASQSPQTASGGDFAPGQKADAVQSGTPQAALDTNSGGIPLGGSAPTVVNVPAAQTTATTQKTPVKEQHKSTPVGTGLSVLFIVAAIILLWSAARPVKNTTD